MNTKLNNSGVVFLEDTHQYFLGDNELSGITTPIGNQLFPDEFANIPKSVLEAATQRGILIHKTLDKLMNFELVDNPPQEALDYLELIKENNLKVVATEYTVTDYDNYASNIDTVFINENGNFVIGDIKTVSNIDAKKMLRYRFQLSIYKDFFLQVNPDAVVEDLLIIHLRYKQKADGSYEHIKELIKVTPIPFEITRDLLACDLEGRSFENPFTTPKNIEALEPLIRQLTAQKQEVEQQLAEIKEAILLQMVEQDAKSWTTSGGLKLTFKSGGFRQSFDYKAYAKKNPEQDLSAFMKETRTSPSLVITL